MLVLALTTGLYAFLAGPALRFLLTGGSEGLGLAAKVLPQLAQLDRATVLWAFPIALVLIGVVKGVAYLGQFYAMGMFGQRVGAELRRRLFTQLSSLSPVQLSSHRVGDLLSRFSTDAASVELAANYTLGAWVRDGLQLVVLVVVAFVLNWKLSLGALIIVPIAALPVARLTRSFFKRTREGMNQMGALAAQVGEGLGGLKTIQAFNAQGAELKRFEANAEAQRRSLTRAGWTRGAVPALMEILAAGAVAGVLAFAAFRMSVPPDELISFLTALILISQPAKELGRVGQFAVQASAASARLLEVLEAGHPVPDAKDAKAAPDIRASVRFEGVRFQYGERAALNGLDLELPVGKVTALVGGSGGGKSTVAALLLRFDRPQQGRVLIDGVEVGAYSADSVRSKFALVTQEPLLFAGTVMDNLRFGRPDATDAEVHAAASAAQADAFIRALPNGYQTKIGERGAILSGGQRQRLCLARALVANAQVLILDEATSSLDPEHEAEVQQALATILPGRTALVIAHRLSTIANADRIVVMEQGAAVEQGSHQELLARAGVYARLWSLQSHQRKAG
jgi:subfamily B ATP-binding cassette protein MsbA